jgi:hypothetical protein
MTLLLQKVQHMYLDEIKAYKEGVFWVAYEQSAYFVWLAKGYKPTKRWVKSSTIEVVQIGFPSLDVLLNLPTLKTVVKEVNFISLETTIPIDVTAFAEWKKELPLFEKKSKNTKEKKLPGCRVVELLQQFDVAAHTPIAAMLFIIELKKILD